MSRTIPVLLVSVTALALCSERMAAQIPSADGVFYACVRIAGDGDAGHLMRFVAANESCRVNETLVHWNVTGPQGAPGTAGTPGTSVNFVGYFSGNSNGCPNGGAVYAAGTTNTYVCNGTNGTATHAAPPCFDNTNRYVNCGNGTVTDTATGLIWLQQVDCISQRDYAAANSAVALLASGQCGLNDNSVAGDWRLPTVDEWSATIAQAVVLGCYANGPGGAPSLTNDAGTGCLSLGPSSFAGVASVSYWSGSTFATSTNLPTTSLAWVGVLKYGGVSGVGKGFPFWVWPVRAR